MALRKGLLLAAVVTLLAARGTVGARLGTVAASSQLAASGGSGAAAAASASATAGAARASPLLAARPRRPLPSTFLNDALHESLGDSLKELWYNQQLDHFHYDRDDTWAQRYFVCTKWWKPPAEGGAGAPIFFYAGNEADVTLYLNNTGIIWENAAAFGALVVFAEHRYYGQSQPFGPNSWAVDPSYLTVEQALADYAQLLHELRLTIPGAEDSAVIAFGGSYGGMLAAWLRAKYPHVVMGAVAASAPVGAFPGVPGWDPSRFWEVVTYDATIAAGSSPNCAVNVRSGFALVRAMGAHPMGRGVLQRLLRLCGPLRSEADALDAAYWLQGAFDAFAMGNYPYPSTYISDDPLHPLPAWPMRAACEHAGRPGPGAKPAELLEALRDAVGVLYNVSGTAACYNTTTTGPAAGNRGPWDYQWCTELMGQELPYYPATGKSDMFWDQGEFDLSVINTHCLDAWGVQPRPTWTLTTYGGTDFSRASNIVFSNGLLDPWSAFGILSDFAPNSSVVPIIIPQGAHHVDTMFSHPDDPPCVRAARKKEMEHVRRWVDEHAAEKKVARASAAAQQEQQQRRWPRWSGATGAAAEEE